MSLLIDFARVLEGFKAHSMPSAHRLVMALYANHAGAKDHAFPSLACLSDETGIGKTKLVEVVAELVEFGWLVPDGFVGEGLRRAARYKVRLDGKPWPEDSRARGARSTVKALASRIAARSPRVPPGETLADRPAVGSCTADPGSAYRRAVTNLPVTHQINPPEEPIAHVCAPVPARDDRPTFTPTPEPAPLVLTSPDAAEKPKPAKGRRKPAVPVPEDPAGLSPVERAAFEAIAADPSLQPITVGVCQLVRDLCKNCPSVDVAREVRKAGMWMRADPSRRKKNGAAFLANWVERAQNDAAKLPQTARPRVREELPLSTPRVPPNPRDIAKPESILRARAERNARIAAGEVLEDPQVECERVMKEVMQKLAPARVYA